MIYKLFAFVMAALLLAGCASASGQAAEPTLVPTLDILENGEDPVETLRSTKAPAPDPTETALPGKRSPGREKTITEPPLLLATPTQPPRPTFDPADWVNQPVLPELSPRAIEILRDGLERGNNPRVFSKIGDCESQTDWFLDHYDLGPEHYSLGPYEEELAPVIAYYAGSFDRTSLAARQGFTAASLLAPIWADKKLCEKNESPLACEIRRNRPAVAFIMLGTNDATNPKTFEGHMRKVIEYTIAQGVLPILGTKADNIEGDHRINATIARLAYEYDIPLWNYWLAIQDLPGHGLQEDGAHLTFAGPFFDNTAAFRKAWPVRNLNALQILKIVMEQTNN